MGGPPYTSEPFNGPSKASHSAGNQELASAVTTFLDEEPHDSGNTWTFTAARNIFFSAVGHKSITEIDMLLNDGY